MVETVQKASAGEKFFLAEVVQFCCKNISFFLTGGSRILLVVAGGMVTGGEACAERGAVPKAGFGWSSRSGRKTKTERQRAAEGDLQMVFAPKFFYKFNFMLKNLYNLKFFDIFYEKATQN